MAEIPFFKDALQEIENSIDNLDNCPGYKEAWFRKLVQRNAFLNQPLLDQALQEFGLESECSAVGSEFPGCPPNDTSQKLLELKSVLIRERVEYYHLALRQHKLLQQLQQISSQQLDPTEIEYTEKLLVGIGYKLKTLRLVGKESFGMDADLIELRQKLLGKVQEKRSHLDQILLKKDEYDRLSWKYGQLLLKKREINH